MANGKEIQTTPNYFQLASGACHCFFELITISPYPILQNELNKTFHFLWDEYFLQGTDSQLSFLTTLINLKMLVGEILKGRKDEPLKNYLDRFHRKKRLF